MPFKLTTAVPFEAGVRIVMAVVVSIAVKRRVSLSNTLIVTAESSNVDARSLTVITSVKHTK